jgi:hypothetical protein
MGSTAPATDHDALAHIMAERILGTTTHAEALRQLRAAFPDSPLTVRVAALALLIRCEARERPGARMPG